MRSIALRNLSRALPKTTKTVNPSTNLLMRSTATNSMNTMSTLNNNSQNLSLQSRSFYYTVQKLTRDEVKSKVDAYHDELLGCNWGDYLELVHNVPFLEAEMEKIQAHIDPYLNDEEIGPKFDYCVMATDAMYACEDVRDHVNEILELMTRKTGILGMGINAGPPIDNMDEQTEMLSKQYEKLLVDFPEMKPKIEQSVGHGLAILRMKHKFKHPMGYRFYY